MMRRRKKEERRKKKEDKGAEMNIEAQVVGHLVRINAASPRGRGVKSSARRKWSQEYDGFPSTRFQKNLYRILSSDLIQ